MGSNQKLNVVLRAKIKHDEIEAILEAFKAGLEENVTMAMLIDALRCPDTPRNRLRILARIRDVRFLADQQGLALSDYDFATKSWKLTECDTARIIKGLDRRTRTASTLLEGAVMHASWVARTAKDPWDRKFAEMALEAGGSAISLFKILGSTWRLRGGPGEDTQSEPEEP